MKRFRARSAAIVLAAMLATTAAPAQAAPLPAAGPALSPAATSTPKISAPGAGMVASEGFRDEFAKLRCLFFGC